ncbi:hypothetical protein B0H13DRAFT_1493800, partial [Mycena leptocephala]
AVRDALMQLSSNLYDAYDHTLERINRQTEEDRELALRTLSWAVHAKTPLQPLRLQEALAIEPRATTLDPDRRTDIELVLAVRAGLVVIDEEDNKLRLIHYTTQQYFEMDRVKSRIFPHTQTQITQTCFTYMSFFF